MGVAVAPDKASVARAREAALCLDKTLRTLLLYPPTNPLPGEFKARLHEVLGRFFAEHGPLTLEAKGVELFFGGEAVHRDGAGEEGLAAALVRDGVRSFTFQPGLEFAELEGFLSVLRRGIKERGGDGDLAVALWAASLRKISYESVGEIESPDDAAREKSFWAKAAQTERSGSGGERVGSGAAECASRPREGAGSLERSFDLSGEPGSLEERRAEAADFDPVGATVEVLLEVVALDETPSDFGQTCALLEGLYDGFVERAEYSCALRVLESVRAAAPRMDAPRARRLDAVLARACEAAAVGRLCVALDADPAADPALARKLLEALPEEGLVNLVDALGALRHRPARRLLCDVLVARGAGAVEAIGRAVSDPRWYVARNAAMILGRIGGAGVCPFLEKALGNAADAVRREAVEALARMNIPEARGALGAALRDPDSLLRVRALGALCRGGRPQDAERVEARVQAPDFSRLPGEEQQEWLSTLARLRGDAALPTFQALIRRRLFDWGPRRRLRPLAVLALAYSDGPRSQAYLVGLAQGRDKPVREAAELALGRMAGREGAPRA